MSNSYPWFPFYAKDWISDFNVASMSLECRGAFITLLALQWVEGGFLSTDEKIKKYLEINGTTPHRAAKIWAELKPLFPELLDNPSKRGNPKLDDILRDRQRASRRLAEAGRKGGQAKARLKPGYGQAEARGESESESESEHPTPNPQTTSALPRRAPQKTTTPKPPNWVSEAIDDWSASHGAGSGAVIAGRIGKALKHAVKAHDWPTIRPGWQHYLKTSEADYQSPENYAKDWMRWQPIEHAFEGMRMELTFDLTGRFAWHTYKGGKWVQDA